MFASYSMYLLVLSGNLAALSHLEEAGHDGFLKKLIASK